MLRRVPALLLLAALVPACSSDAAPEPEATLDTPGAFISVEEDDGTVSLNRMLDYYNFGPDTLLFFTVYEVSPKSFDEAREIAKRHDIPIRYEAIGVSRSKFAESDYRVVWFRTLTEEERERAF